MRKGKVSVELKARSLCPWEKIPLCLLNRLGGSYNKFERFGEKSFLVIELPSLGQNHSVSLMCV